MRNLRFRRDEYVGQKSNRDVDLPANVFLRILNGLTLDPNTRLSLSTMLGSRNQSRSLANLALVSIELFGIYRAVRTKSNDGSVAGVAVSIARNGDSEGRALVAAKNNLARKHGAEVNAIRKRWISAIFRIDWNRPTKASVERRCNVFVGELRIAY